MKWLLRLLGVVLRGMSKEQAIAEIVGQALEEVINRQLSANPQAVEQVREALARGAEVCSVGLVLLEDGVLSSAERQALLDAIEAWRAGLPTPESFKAIGR